MVGLTVELEKITHTFGFTCSRRLLYILYKMHEEVHRKIAAMGVYG